MAVPPAPDDRSGVTEDDSAPDDQPGPVPAGRVPAGAPDRPERPPGPVRRHVRRPGGDRRVQRRPSTGADESDADRQQVMSQAQQFILRVNTYGPDLLADDGTMPEYREQVLEVITDKFAASFEESVPAAESTVAQAGLRAGRRGVRRRGLRHRRRLRDRAGGRLVHQLLPGPGRRLQARVGRPPAPVPGRDQAGQGRRRVAGRRLHARDRRGRGARRQLRPAGPPSEEASP